MKKLFNKFSKGFAISLVLSCGGLVFVWPDWNSTLQAQDYECSINGKVVDQTTSEAISSGANVSAYRSNGSSWDFAASVYISPSSPTFTLNLTETGTYYIKTSAVGYASEYYNNTRLFDNKKLLILAKGDVKTLQTIKLAPLPIRISNFKLLGSTVPSEGGSVTLTADVVNSTANSVTVQVWPMLQSRLTIYECTEMMGAMEIPGAKTLQIPAGSSEPFQLIFKVPAKAYASNTYCTALLVGYSKWQPLHMSTPLCFSKLSDNDTQQAFSTAMDVSEAMTFWHHLDQQIPEKISWEGETLEYLEVDQQANP